MILKRRRILAEPEPEDELDPELDPEEDEPPVLVLGGEEVLELFPLLVEEEGGEEEEEEEEGDEVLELFPLLVEEVVGGAGGGATIAHLKESDSLLMTSSVQLKAGTW